MSAVTRILVPLDFSQGSRAALRHAGYLAKQLGAKLDVLHVWEPSPVVAPDHLSWLGGGVDTFWVNLSEDLKKRLAKLVAEEIPDAAEDVTVEVEAGYVANTILRRLKKNGHDLIVMGTHGRTGLSHLVMGSVAERIVRLSPVPVMTVRVPRERKRSKSRAGAHEASEVASSETAGEA